MNPSYPQPWVDAKGWNEETGPEAELRTPEEEVSRAMVYMLEYAYLEGVSPPVMEQFTGLSDEIVESLAPRAISEALFRAASMN